MIHSGRGCQPMTDSHWGAPWWDGWKIATEPPDYPGTQWDGKTWNRETLRDFYQP